MRSVLALVLAPACLVAAASTGVSGGFGIGGVPGVTPHDKKKAGISNGQLNEWRDRMRKWWCSADMRKADAGRAEEYPCQIEDYLEKARDY